MTLSKEELELIGKEWRKNIATVTIFITSFIVSCLFTIIMYLGTTKNIEILCYFFMLIFFIHIVLLLCWNIFKYFYVRVVLKYK